MTICGGARQAQVATRRWSTPFGPTRKRKRGQGKGDKEKDEGKGDGFIFALME